MPFSDKKLNIKIILPLPELSSTLFIGGLGNPTEFSTVVLSVST